MKESSIFCRVAQEDLSATSFTVEKSKTADAIATAASLIYSEMSRRTSSALVCDDSFGHSYFICSQAILSGQIVQSIKDHISGFSIAFALSP